MADIPATDLTPETSATLNGAEQFVMFDTVEGKRCTLSDIATFIRRVLGAMEYKIVRCNGTAETSDRAGFKFKQEVSWPGMSAGDFVFCSVSQGAYNTTFGIESAEDKAVLWFSSQPSSSLYVSIHRCVAAEAT